MRVLFSRYIHMYAGIIEPISLPKATIVFGVQCLPGIQDASVLHPEGYEVANDRINLLCYGDVESLMLEERGFVFGALDLGHNLSSDDTTLRYIGSFKWRWWNGECHLFEVSKS